MALGTFEHRGRLEDVQISIYEMFMIAEFSSSGILLNANERFLRRMGYQPHEVIGEHHSMFLQTAVIEDPSYKAFWAQLTDGQARSGEVLRKSKSGDLLWLRSNYIPLLDRLPDEISILKVATVIDVASRHIHTPLEALDPLCNVKEAQGMVAEKEGKR